MAYYKRVAVCATVGDMKRMLLLCCVAPVLLADTITLKDGQSISGIVRTVAAGKVTIEVDGQARTFDIPQVQEIDFDTPHVEAPPSVGEVPVREFTQAAEKLIRAQRETQRTYDAIKARWSVRKTVEPDQANQWNADRERFAAPFGDYRQAIRQLYLDVAAHIDNYNKIAGDAEKLYVGVKGLLNVGSPLIRDADRERPLKDFIPGYWYDQIYYQAYRKGFDDAVEFQRLAPR